MVARADLPGGRRATWHPDRFSTRSVSIEMEDGTIRPLTPASANVLDLRRLCGAGNCRLWLDLPLQRERTGEWQRPGARRMRIHRHFLGSAIGAAVGAGCRRASFHV